MNPYAPSRRPSGGRLALVIIGALAALASVAILAGAVALHWFNKQSDDGGFYNTETVRIAADTYAVMSENVEIDKGFLDVVGAERFRLTVRANTDTPVFAGVARPEDVARYLGDSPRAMLDDVEFAPFNPTYRIVGNGRVTPQSPGSQVFWTTYTSGTGTQVLQWETTGRWAVVLMNADGSRGVDASVSAGAQASLIGTLAWIVTMVGLGVLTLGVLLILLGLRRRPQPPSLPAGSAWGA